MPPKRKRAEDVEPSGPIIYASEVPWLRFLIEKSEEVSHDETKNVEINVEHIMAACKVVYLLYHKLDDRLPLIIQSLNTGSTTSDAELTKAARLQQSLWKGMILNKFFFSHVSKIRQDWHVAHAYASFEALEDSERTDMWIKAYKDDPAGTIYAMTKPVGEVLDFSRIFKSRGLPEADQAKMKAVRTMLYMKYLFGCQLTYSMRVYEDMKTKKVVSKKDQCFAEWTNFANDDLNTSTIVPIGDLPISAAFLDDLTTKSEHASKKMKQGSMLEDIVEADYATTAGSVPQTPEPPGTTASRAPRAPTAKQPQEDTKKPDEKHTPYSLEFFAKRPRNPETLDEFFGGAREMEDDTAPATLKTPGRPSTKPSETDDGSA